MQRRSPHFGAERPLLRGICLVVKGPRQRVDRRKSSRAAANRPAEFPRRPNSQAFSESIPLFFIARNENGLWVAREAEGRTGGMFLFKRSAVRFAQSKSASGGCATMFPAERIELDVANDGGTCAAWVDALLRMAARRMTGDGSSCVRSAAPRTRPVKVQPR
jgi:hypothetical protein